MQIREFNLGNLQPTDRDRTRVRWRLVPEADDLLQIPFAIVQLVEPF